MVSYPVSRYLYRPLSTRAARVLEGTPITPGHVTLVSALLSTSGAVAFGYRSYWLGAALSLLGIITDCIDGDLSRLTGRSSTVGAFLDSVMDRWTDAAMIVGLAYANPRYWTLAGVALTASLLTSYTRARAQSLGVDCPDGIGGRDTRVLLLVLAAPAGLIELGLWAVAVTGVLTSVHRTLVATRRLKALESPAATPAPGRATAV
ncbi:MAG TPA: CDP-alcohol phosphatidyltransferase family protein [Actinomycetota bacterium]|nr:CDP-alcohol phosphatidyltransferase family protein [Actinomycetota bacterium]